MKCFLSTASIALLLGSCTGMTTFRSGSSGERGVASNSNDVELHKIKTVTLRPYACSPRKKYLQDLGKDPYRNLVYSEGASAAISKEINDSSIFPFGDHDELKTSFPPRILLNEICLNKPVTEWSRSDYFSTGGRSRLYIHSFSFLMSYSVTILDLGRIDLRNVDFKSLGLAGTNVGDNQQILFQDQNAVELKQGHVYALFHFGREFDYIVVYRPKLIGQDLNKTTTLEYAVKYYRRKDYGSERFHSEYEMKNSY